MREVSPSASGRPVRLSDTLEMSHGKLHSPESCASFSSPKSKSWLPKHAVWMCNAFMTGTMWSPCVTVDIIDGLKQSPEKSTSGFSAAKLFSSPANRAAPPTGSFARASIS
eukprot:977927-Prymnesium_polylepis.1